jgi:hypothetical protein
VPSDLLLNLEVGYIGAEIVDRWTVGAGGRGSVDRKMP